MVVDFDVLKSMGLDFKIVDADPHTMWEMEARNYEGLVKRLSKYPDLELAINDRDSDNLLVYFWSAALLNEDDDTID